MKGKIFNAQEVQAILAGNKTQFRDVIKPKPWHVVIDVDFKKGDYVAKYGHGEKIIKCPYQVGQKIFVKEVFSEDWLIYDDNFGESCVGEIFYKSTWEKDKKDFDEPNWKSPVHMKQEHSRLTLQIKEIGVEKLSEISADDCWREGVILSSDCCENYVAVADCNGNPTPSCCNNPNVVHPQPQFEQIWNATHKKPEEKFEDNPWVLVYSFEVVK